MENKRTGTANGNPGVNQNQNVETIDLMDVFGVIGAKIRTILLSTGIVALIAFLITRFLIVPEYSSTAKLYVLSKSTSITSLADVQMGASLTSDYTQVVASRPVIDQVIKDLDLDTDYDALSKKVTVENPTDTRIINITVTDRSVKHAKKIADRIAEVSAEFIGNKMDQDPPTIIQKGYTDSGPVNIQPLRNTVIGALIGFLVAAAVAIISFYLNDTIQTPEDAEKIGLHVLGSLPLDTGVEQEKPEAGNGHHHRRRQELSKDAAGKTKS